MRFKLLLLSFLISFASFSQNLKSFSATMRPDSLCYLSLSNAKAYTASSAAAVKSALDLGLFEKKEEKYSMIQFFNLKTDNEQVPATLTGTRTKINAISFDRDQFDKCKTIADLKRMAGYITTTSLSDYGVIKNNSDYYQKCFIVERENGKRGLIFVTPVGNNLKVEVKTE